VGTGDAGAGRVHEPGAQAGLKSRPIGLWSVHGF
jgi:hypothetical protein